MHAESDDDVDPIREVVGNMEDSLFSSTGRDADSHNYKAKLRSLVYNLSKNAELCTQIVTGCVDAASVPLLNPRELASEADRRRIELNERQSMEARQADWEDENYDKMHKQLGISSKSLYRCKHCGSYRTNHIQKQTRAADEPMTVFLYCIDCKKRDKFC